MKIKKSLVALTTASAVALSGTAVATAEENVDTPPATQQDGSLAELSSDNEGGLAGSLDDMFGWNDADVVDEDGKVTEEKTTGLQKFKDIAGLFTLIVGVIGTAATLMTTLEKFAK